MNLNLLKKQIHRHEEEGNYEEIIQFLKNILKKKEIDKDIREFAQKEIKQRLYNIAYDCFSDLELQKALIFCLEAIKYDENSLELKKLISNIHFELENYSDSLEHFLEYLESKPNDAEVLRNIGIAYIEHSQYNKAKSYLERAIEINPNDSLTLAKLGSIYLDLDDFENAINFYESSLGKSVNKFPVEWQNLGHAHLSYALSLMVKSEVIDVDKINDILNRAKKYYDIAFEKEQTRSYPTEPDFHAWYEYGEINFYLGEEDIANEAFLKAKSIDINLWNYWEGDTYFEMMKADEEIVKKIISDYLKKQKKKMSLIFYCRNCKMSYNPSDSLQKTLDGKLLCPKHGIILEKYQDFRDLPK